MPFWLQPPVHKQTCYKWPHHCQEKKRWQLWYFMEELCQVVLSLASYPSLSYRLCESFSQRADAIHGHEQMLGAEVRHTKQNPILLCGCLPSVPQVFV